ncbi:hypothetical protein [Frankia sp. CiP3]|uniref:hypothetical protein n=1 Tax=Frankia sp. CiP3 TaxID=2880971 RepID=UPI001EF6525E|nr:hypothetical protein [Frankia sp. CiP3]
MTTTTTDPMSDTIPDKAADALGAGTVPVLDEELARRLVAQARAEEVRTRSIDRIARHTRQLAERLDDPMGR